MPAHHNPIGMSELLPKIAIRRIVISGEKATLTCVLRRPREVNYDNWLGSAEFNSYIKYYFIAAPGLAPSQISKFYYPSQRVGHLMLSPQHPMENWEDSLGPASPDLDGEIANPYSLKGHTTLTLDEILQGQYFAQDPLTATETQEVIPEDDQSGSNTPFQVSINLINDPFSSEARGPELNILAFAQLDLKKIKEDFGLSVLRPLAEIGSELLYEKCLVSSPDAQNNRMIVPETRKIFFTPDGDPYDGPSHYHSSLRPGPNNYVGWMTGPAEGDMSERQELTSRVIPNNKIVSRLFIEEALNFLGEPVTDTNTFSGYVGPGEIIATPTGNLSFGDDILQTLKAQSGLMTSIGSAENNTYHEELKKLTIKSIKKGNVNVSDARIHPNDLSWIQINNGARSYHGNIFLIKVGDILSNNSSFGHILDLHEGQDFLGSWSQAIYADIISKSKLQQLSVFRRRITSGSVGNNSVSTPEPEIYDTDVPEKYIINTTSSRVENSTSFLQTKTNSLAQIRENYSTPSPNKTIILNDYDLFENVSYGWYEYVLDITLEDGIKKYMVEKQSEFASALKVYSEHVTEARRPYLDHRQSNYYNGNQFADGLSDQRAREVNNTTGNYNFSIDDFTPSFKALSTQSRYRTDNIVEAYISVYYLLTANSGFSYTSKSALKTSLLAENTTLQSLEYFLDLCLKLKTRLDSIIDQSGKALGEITNLGPFQKNVNKGLQFPDKLIRLRGVANIRSEAVRGISVFTTPETTEANNVAAAGPGSFFALTSDKSIKSNPSVKIPNLAGTGEFSEATAKIFEMEIIATPGAATTSEELSKLSSKVMAAVERSKVAEIVSENKENGIDNELVEFDELLAQYGNTTFKSLVSEAVGTSAAATENKTPEKVKYISEDLQSSIYSSIISSDNQKHFEEETEKQYKDLFFRKEALGDLYGKVKTLLATHKNITKAKSATSYREKITGDASTGRTRDQKNKNFQEAESSIKDKIFNPYTIDPVEGLVPAQTGGTTGIVIYKKDSDSLSGVVLANNVKFLKVEAEVEQATTSQSRRPPTKGGKSY